MDLILPLSVHFRRKEQSDLFRLELLVRSVEAFWRGGDTLHIITPDMKEVAAEVARLRPKLRVVLHSDESVFASMNVRPWLRQQVLKLAANRVVDSDFYLVLDADCFFVRPTTASDLVTEGRGRVCFGRGIPYSSSPWYVGCRELGLKVPSSNGVNMTPFVMHRQLAADALQYVLERTPVIGPFRWSEYTLYHCVAAHNGTWDSHHFTGAPLLGNEIWTSSRFRKWDPAKCFVPGDFPLSLVQSAAGASGAQVRAAVLPYIDKALGRG